MTGYGQQCALWARKLAGLGHDVAVSAFWGLQGTTLEWQGIRVYPGGLTHHGNDVLAGHVQDYSPDLVIVLTDVWVMNPDLLKTFNAACWMPVDCAPLGVYDRDFLDTSGVVPVAMSEFGRDVLARAGYSPLYVPHGIDAAQTFVPQDRGKCRDLLGLPSGAFVIGINAANKDPERKGFAEQLMAFAMFRQAHPDALLLLHTTAQGVGDGIDLAAMAARLDLTGSVRFSDQYKYVTGGYTARDMAAWYGCLDVYSGAALAEGFGLPLAEAQACFPAQTPITASRVLRGIERKYTGEMIYVTTARGDTITATSEHPFWTRRGWIPAGQLRSDDQLLYTGRHASSGVLQIQSGRIGDVVAALRANANVGSGTAYGQDHQRVVAPSQALKATQVVLTEKPASPYFGHGASVGLPRRPGRRRGHRLDPQTGWGQVEAHGAHRWMPLAADAVAGGNLQRSLDLYRASARPRGSATPVCVPYVRAVPSSDLRDHAALAGRQADPDGVRDRVHQDPSGAGQADSTDGASASTDSYRARPQYQSIDAIERRTVRSIPVYNLTTASGTYTADGYLVHNCGIPVVTTDASAMTELCGAGWLAGGEPYWNRGHLAPWCRPHVQEIADAYEAAVTEAAGMADKAREFALRYDADRVLHEHWVPALERLAP